MLTDVEKYKITEEIGHGGMATVYRARDTRLDRLVALKVMHPHLQGAKEARARFTREAISVARLKHPGILEIYDYSGEESDISYIATELLTGPTLKRFVDDNPDIPAEIAACFAIALTRALSVAHAQGVIHRDVKPENVLLHENREVKLTDFGIAQLVGAQSMTTTGQVLGSPGHMAPEQVEGKECDVRSDIFSLGTVLYLLATGKLPFSGRNPHQILKQIVEGRFADPLQVKPSIGSRLSDIIKKCLQVDPERRYQNAVALESDLVAFVSQLDITSPLETLAEYLKQPEAFATSFREKVLRHLIRVGEEARLRREIALSLDYFNRALAMDEGNERVLSSLEKIGRRSRARNAIRALTITFAAVGLVALIVVVQFPNARKVNRVAAIKNRSTTAKGQFEKIERPNKPRERAGRATDQDPELARTEKRNKDRPKVKTKHAEGNSRSTIDITENKGTETAHRIVFNPVPANVSIAVDNAEPKAFGPSFREIELSPGIHTIKIIGAYECCFDQEFQVEVPSSPGTTVIERKLEYRPAGLYVVSDVPANISVDDGKVLGRVRNVIQIPHQYGMIETHRIMVTANGYKPYTQDVQLQAGRVETVNVELERLETTKGE
ncbi:MAG: serine/threonine protein kinase [Deltaproteobacteria bacterium]|nr:serine/threonine protein kinase [Deltaproteobacteria bacterium]